MARELPSIRNLWKTSRSTLGYLAQNRQLDTCWRTPTSDVTYEATGAHHEPRVGQGYAARPRGEGNTKETTSPFKSDLIILVAIMEQNRCFGGVKHGAYLDWWVELPSAPPIVHGHVLNFSAFGAKGTPKRWRRSCRVCSGWTGGVRGGRT